GREQVLKAIDRSASALRRRLGESAGMIEQFDTPVEEATTASLEALKAYHLAQETRAHQGDLASVPLFERAIELDPNFAMAYARLSTASSNLSRYEQADHYMREAFARRDRVSEIERL